MRQSRRQPTKYLHVLRSKYLSKTSVPSSVKTEPLFFLGSPSYLIQTFLTSVLLLVSSEKGPFFRSRVYSGVSQTHSSRQSSSCSRVILSLRQGWLLVDQKCYRPSTSHLPETCLNLKFKETYYEFLDENKNEV